MEISCSTPVADSEYLIRLTYSPIHVVDGQLIPAAISSDDLSTRGFSLDREALLDIQVLNQRNKSQQSKLPQDRQSAFVSRLQCSCIRNEVLQDDGELAFRVLAEPLDSNRAHAAVYSAVPRGRMLIKALKALLLPHLNREVMALEALVLKAERKN